MTCLMLMVEGVGAMETEFVNSTRRRRELVVDPVRILNKLSEIRRTEPAAQRTHQGERR